MKHNINELLKINDSYQAPQRLMEILFNQEEREQLFREMLSQNHDVSFDWFHEYFESEHADRKEKKQDFTPNSISTLISKLAGAGEGSNLDVAAGTGGITITKWQEDRMKESPFTYKPSEHYYQCEELSDRAIPFLLFNLMIRGMNATVLHGDTLTRKFKGVFFIQNEKDDHMLFSSLNVVPDSKGLREFLMIKDYQNIYSSHIESKDFPVHLNIGSIPKEINLIGSLN